GCPPSERRLRLCRLQSHKRQTGPPPQITSVSLSMPRFFRSVNGPAIRLLASRERQRPEPARARDLRSLTLPARPGTLPTARTRTRPPVADAPGSPGNPCHGPGATKPLFLLTSGRRGATIADKSSSTRVPLPREDRHGPQQFARRRPTPRRRQDAGARLDPPR